MMQEAGLDEFALEQVYGNGLVPNVTTEEGLKDPENPCDGAVERKHSHFFTAGGAFGSKDFDVQQVDDGMYTLEGDEGIVINGKRFKYQINGDELSLEPEPVDISGCTTKECRFAAGVGADGRAARHDLDARRDLRRVTRYCRKSAERVSADVVASSRPRDPTRWPARLRVGSRTDQGCGAGDEARTRDMQLGRLPLYQLSYSRRDPEP